MSELQQCPYCAEQIQAAALLCRFCDRGISEEHYRKCPSCAEMILREAAVCRWCKEPVARAGAAAQEAASKKSALERKFGVSFIALDDAMVRPDCVRLLPEEFVREHRAVPVRWVGARVLVAMVDPGDVVAMDEVIARLDAAVQPVVCTPEAFQRFMSERYAKLVEEDEEESADLGDVNDDGVDDELEIEVEPRSREPVHQQDFEPKEDNGPIITLANMIIADGIKCGARQIRLEPKDGKVAVLNVVRGQAKVARSLSTAIAKPLMARLKDMARPHGFAHTSVGGRNYHVRVEATKTEFGEYVFLEPKEMR